MFSAQAVTRICIVVLNYSIPSFLSLLTQSVGGTRANPSLVRPSFEKGVEGFAKEDYDLIRPLSALLGSSYIRRTYQRYFLFWEWVNASRGI